MTEVEKLRSLLAEARMWVWYESPLRTLIDAALAEPVKAEWEQRGVADDKMIAALREAQKQRDEARAEVERLKDEVKQIGVKLWAAQECIREGNGAVEQNWVYIQRAYQRGAEAMREAAAKIANDAAVLTYESECSSLAERIEERIRALPVPEDQP